MIRWPFRCDPVPDQWRERSHGLRLAVEQWKVLAAVTGEYIERRRSARMVWHYLRSVGLVAVIRKIRSRLAEVARNRKVAAVGVGTVLEVPVGSQWRLGERVLFFAPNHPRGPRRICIDERFAVSISECNLEAINTREEGNLSEPLTQYIGWSVFSGVPVDQAAIRVGLAKFTLWALSFDRESKNHSVGLPIANGPGERIVTSRLRTGKPSAVLFGFGNYAKAIIIPYMRRSLDLRCVHEVDPDQLVALTGSGMALDTSPEPREGENYDAWFIAGFHHTHAPLAVRALCDGSYAVVEKPLATTWEQLSALKSALHESDQGGLFGCFHKRYWRLNDWAQHDLGVASGEPVDMHSIVYEIPLPRLHWYNWPNSGSRIMSNGCHWLDYFLYMNAYCEVSDAGVWRGRGSDLAVFVRLENGATLVMSLSDTGSERLGVRELIELRAGEVTVRITDAMRYESESSVRVIRRTRVNPMDAYRRMYRDICHAIVAGNRGDTIDSLCSTELMLHLEDEIQSYRRGTVLSA